MVLASVTSAFLNCTSMQTAVYAFVGANKYLDIARERHLWHLLLTFEIVSMCLFLCHSCSKIHTSTYSLISLGQSLLENAEMSPHLIRWEMQRLEKHGWAKLLSGYFRNKICFPHWPLHAGTTHIHQSVYKSPRVQQFSAILSKCLVINDFMNLDLTIFIHMPQPSNLSF